MCDHVPVCLMHQESTRMTYDSMFEVAHEGLRPWEALQLPSFAPRQAPGFPPMQGEEQSSALFFMDSSAEHEGPHVPIL